MLFHKHDGIQGCVVDDCFDCTPAGLTMAAVRIWFQFVHHQVVVAVDKLTRYQSGRGGSGRSHLSVPSPGVPEQ